MLKTAIITATILGCDCDAKQCEYIRDEPAQWTTIEDCEADVRARTFEGAGPAYPTVVAVCYAPAASTAEAPTEPTTPDTETATVAENATPAPTTGRFFASTVKGYVVVRQSLGTAVDATVDAARWTASRFAAISLPGF